MSEPPNRNLSTCVAALVIYAVIVGCWSAWALRTTARAVEYSRTAMTLLLLADVAVVSVLSVVTGLTSPDD
ncbi:MAG TPA: ATP-binding protein, partial [Mycobacterium sp.]|nr:ATP-binding protein [Mycobacterium sp.]